MAAFVYTNAYLLMNGVDLSDHVKSISLDFTKAQVETTTMNATPYQTFLPGIGHFTFDVEFNQDFASSSVDATLWNMYNAGTTAAFEIRPVNASRTTTNPGFTGSCYVFDYTPVDGSVGTLASVKVTFVSNAGPNKLFS